jgi:hypothetical protein
MSEQITEELHKPTRREPAVARMWRGISGTFAAGLVLLALAMLGIQIYAMGRDLPGAGWDVVAGHWLTAVIAVVAQRYADRKKGWLSALFSLVVLVVGLGALWIFWWA